MSCRSRKDVCSRPASRLRAHRVRQSHHNRFGEDQNRTGHRASVNPAVVPVAACTGGATAAPANPEESLPTVIPVHEPLPCIEYTNGRISSTVSGASVSFTCRNGTPLYLWEVIKKEELRLVDLLDGDLPAGFPEDVSMKISSCMDTLATQFEGHKPYTRQIYVRRETRERKFISKKLLAHQIAAEMQTFLNRERERGRPLVHNGFPVSLYHLSIRRVDRVSTGSWVPFFGIGTWRSVEDERTIAA